MLESVWAIEYVVLDLEKVYLEPGEHQFTAHINADLVDHYENGQKVPAPDPQSGQFRFGADSDKTEWRTLQPYLKMNAHTWTFTIDEARDVNIGIEIRLPHALKSNGVFIDALELVRLVPEPPQRQFDQEIHLYAQNLSPKKLSQVLAYAKPKEQSMTPSVDSAFFWGPALKTKTVHVWDAVSVAGGRQALRAWVETYHKPWPKVIWHEFEEEKDWVDDLIWMRDPRWADRTFGNGYITTMYKEGCFIAAVCSAHRIFWDDDYTPNDALDKLTAQDFDDDSALLEWAACKSKMGVEILKRTTDASEVEVHLKNGGLALAEMLPSSLLHFVLVVEKDGDDWVMLDPLFNVVTNVRDKYAGVESWRLIRKASSITPVPPPPPPPLPPRIKASPHMQRAFDKWPNVLARAVAAGKPIAAVKVVDDGMQKIEEIRAISPQTLTIFRKANPPEGLDYFIYADDPFGALNKSSFATVFDEAAELGYDVIETPINESIGTNDIDVVKATVKFDVAYARWCRERSGGRVAPGIINPGPGNPDHGYETSLLVPAALAAIEHGGYLMPHTYFPVHPEPGISERWMESPQVQLDYHLRPVLSWLETFEDHGIDTSKVKFVFGEGSPCGAHINDVGLPGGFKDAGCGWRRWDALGGNLDRCLNLNVAYEVLCQKYDNVVAWTIFTSGRANWTHFQWEAEWELLLDRLLA